MATSPTREFVLHRMVWNDDVKSLKAFLAACKEPKEHTEKLDPRGRTPLLLAVVLRRLECVNVLLEYGANCLAVDKQYWSAMDEATASGDPDLLRLVLQYRHFQLLQIANDTVPKVLAKLRGSPDFYVEMAWSFSSWIPFVSHLLPSDTYKIWKSANAVRVDTSLLGFENRKWKRGRLSLVFRLASKCAEIYEINHDTKQYSLSKIDFQKPPTSPRAIVVSPQEISLRLTNPAVSSYIDVDAISFERAKSGAGFFGSLMSLGAIADRVEDVGGYDCKVYECTDVKLVSQKRTEHLLKEDKKRRTSSSRSSNNVGHDATSGENRLASLLSAAVKRNVEVEERSEAHGEDITEEHYFNDMIDLGNKYLGRPREVTTKVQKFHATLWMSDSFPLSLQDQILPIIDLMAQRHSHVKKLREFITVHLPAGFPVKIDLPLYYVLTATVQQMNVHGTSTPVQGVHTFNEPLIEGQDRPARPAYETTFCAIDESVFLVPPGYRKVDDITKTNGNDFLSSTVEETIESHQSGSNRAFGERLASSITSSDRPPITGSRQNVEMLATEEEAQMQMALAMSLNQINEVPPQGHPQNQVPTMTDRAESDDTALQAALTASLNEMKTTEAARVAQEEADLAAALALSMEEK